jgi:hypothetical protein
MSIERDQRRSIAGPYAELKLRAADFDAEKQGARD